MEKNKYRVFKVETLVYDCIDSEKRKKELGVTYASSEAQAINQIKYRLGIRPRDLTYGESDRYYRKTTFEAVKI